jgi:hypothetical protein
MNRGREKDKTGSRERQKGAGRKRRIKELRKE